MRNRHTLKCRIENFIFNAGIKFDNWKWKRKYPNYCRKCNGWGGTASPGVFGGPPDRCEPPSFDPCEAYDDWTICHRCGEHGLDEDGNGPCTKCGHDMDDGIPDSYDLYPGTCDCFEEEWY